jgi:hypothetical protein
MALSPPVAAAIDPAVALVESVLGELLERDADQPQRSES